MYNNITYNVIHVYIILVFTFCINHIIRIIHLALIRLIAKKK